jgi:WD40 repeat protein
LEEGKVRLVRKADGREIEVNEGSAAVATAMSEPLQTRPLSHGVARLRHSLIGAADAVAFAPDGKTFAGNRSNKLTIWGAADGLPVRTLTGHGDSRFGVAYSPMGAHLLSLSSRKILSRWDPQAGQRQEWPLVEREPARDGALSGDGRWAAVAGGNRRVTVWSVGEAAVEKRFDFAAKDNPGRLALSHEFANGKLRLVYGLWAGAVEVVELIDGQAMPVRSCKLSASPVALALSDDGRTLATYSLPNGLQTWDVASGSKQDIWPGDAARVERLRFSPNGKLVAAGLMDGTVRVWSVSDGRPLLVLDAGCRIVRGLTFDPDGRLLASAGDNGRVKVWEFEINPGQ